MLDVELVRAIVIQAAKEELLPRFARVEKTRKRDGSVVTAADFAMQERIQGELRERWPQYPLLGEEMDRAEQQRLLADPQTPLWCLDPLDGTSNFTTGIPFFSVSLALLEAGKPVLGVVYDPTRDECFSAAKGKGAYLNGDPLITHDTGLNLKQCIAAVDFKRLRPELTDQFFSKPPYGSQRSLGSVALDWCWVSAGRFHVYLHGRQKLWDYAAGSLILDEAGGHSMALDGEPVLRAALESRSAVAALDERLFRDWIAWLGISRRQ